MRKSLEIPQIWPYNQKRYSRKDTEPLENLEQLSRFVYRLNHTDKTSEDYIYYQIIKYLAEFGSFKITDLNKKFHFFKKINGQERMIKIERRKLKNIIYGNDKSFFGLIPLGYVVAIPEFKYRGGNQEYVFYLTEKGILASIGFHSYKKNININKILKIHEAIFGTKYKEFISKFIKLQIKISLSYYYVQGYSRAFTKEHSSEYDKLRSKFIKRFEIRIQNKNLENNFRKLLDELNRYRNIHSQLYKENHAWSLLWQEPMFTENKNSFEHGFLGWYRLQFLIALDGKLKPIKEKPRKNIKTKPQKPTKNKSDPYIYSEFQNNDSVSKESVENTMISLGLKRKRRK